MGFLAGGCVVLHIVSFFYWGYKSSSVETSEPQDSTTSADRDAARDSTIEAASILELMGEDSVYRFFLTKSWWGWGITLVTVAAQFLMCYIFVVGSEYNFKDSISDLKYPWPCPPDLDVCRDTIGRTPLGWLAFWFLMVAHLLKDVIKGLKLIMLSGKTPQFWGKKSLSAFFGGMVMIILSLFVLYASTIYNNAIATTNTDLIANAVIILFVSDLDEMMFSILVVMNPKWLPKDGFQEVMKEKVETLESDMQEVKTDNLEMKEKVNTLESKMQQDKLEHLAMKERVTHVEAEHWETKEKVKPLESEMQQVNFESKEEAKTLESELQQVKAEHLEMKEHFERVENQMSKLCGKL